MTSSQKPAPKVVLPIVLIIALAVLAVGALSFIKSRMGTNLSGSNVQAAATGSAAVGSTIPDFSLTSMQGKPEKFSSITGDVGAKIVLVNFWATWCEACVEEMPSLVQLRQAYKSKGFEVIGINLDENPAAAIPRAQKELGINFPVFSDTEGKVVDYFDVHAIPLSVIVGADRKILYIENGERNWNDQDIRQKLDHWLSEEKS